MASIKGLEKLHRQLQERLARYSQERRVNVAVGYTAAYAAAVHEAAMVLQGEPRPRGRGFYWDPQGQGQAKFLEQPARELSDDGTLGGIVFQFLRKGKTMSQALLAAGLRLQRDSQALVPVDTGNLKNSAFTRLETT